MLPHAQTQHKTCFLDLCGGTIQGFGCIPNHPQRRMSSVWMLLLTEWGSFHLPSMQDDMPFLESGFHFENVSQDSWQDYLNLSSRVFRRLHQRCQHELSFPVRPPASWRSHARRTPLPWADLMGATVLQSHCGSRFSRLSADWAALPGNCMKHHWKTAGSIS